MKMKKTCKFCNKELHDSKYCKNKVICGSIECIKQYHRTYQHKDSVKEYQKLYKSSVEFKQKRREYRIKNREQIKKRYRDKLLYNEKFAITERIRRRFKDALRRINLKKNKSTRLYGIDIESIIKYIGPCPGNRKDYHIDHIKPLSSFDLSKASEIQKAFAPENHQWLTKEENRKKSNFYEANI